MNLKSTENLASPAYRLATGALNAIDKIDYIVRDLKSLEVAVFDFGNERAEIRRTAETEIARARTKAVSEMSKEESRQKSAKNQKLSAIERDYREAISFIDKMLSEGAFDRTCLESSISSLDKQSASFTGATIIGIIASFLVGFQFGWLIAIPIGVLSYFGFSHLSNLFAYNATSLRQVLESAASNTKHLEPEICTKETREKIAAVMPGLDGKMKEAQGMYASKARNLKAKLTSNYQATREEEERSAESLRIASEREWEGILKTLEGKHALQTLAINKEDDLAARRIIDFSDAKIRDINLTLAGLTAKLNTRAAAFDPKSSTWNDASIKKYTAKPFPFIRVGRSVIEIKTDSEHYFETPLLVPFLTRSGMIFNFRNQAEFSTAKLISHNVLARALLALPPSKLRITFFDPLELGGNASVFTSLNREIYGGMVFTQADDLNTQLSALIRSIESIIQQYLQDKFKDIAEYNHVAGDVVESYRILVIYNFPHGFSESTSKKLLNILKSGPKAGVQTLLIADRTAILPYGMDWESIDFYLQTDHTAGILSDAHAGKIIIDEPLPYQEVVSEVNSLYEQRNVTKVPLLKSVPPAALWWSGRSHKTLDIPIGKHTTEIQNLRFDNKDDNQALLIGKPGSGKSNLLHAIIINCLWKYSPDELEIYLIDFKGGVEFTIYADKNIPQIRTLAIESERELGLSVLDGVEKCLLDREIAFSAADVSSIEEYHEHSNAERMPRVLLIIDEFQEFFVEDDAIRNSANAKLDRIVKKGRAFGINTILSSQTLSGNSLQKSTRDLIDIRIALMCSDSDATTVMDERNQAVKDLRTPGEGIYNSENGKVSGNRKFQAFFADRKELNQLIAQVVEYSSTAALKHRPPRQIVFRGSEKARLEKSDHPLFQSIAAPKPKAIRLWLGEPVSIGDDVYATLRHQAGSNLLIVSAAEDFGARMLASSLISINRHYEIGRVNFIYLNFSSSDSDSYDSVDSILRGVRAEYKTPAVRDVSKVLEDLKLELERRIQVGTSDSPDIYVACLSFGRGRIFRKDGYSLSNESTMLNALVKDGPEFGVFVLLHVDSMEGLTRCFDDKIIREFSIRVAGQMNVDGSMKMLGNPKASKLGANRGYYFDDNDNVLLKFKPYELPNLSWVTRFSGPAADVSSFT